MGICMKWNRVTSCKVLLHNFLLWIIFCGIYKFCPVPLFCKFCKLAVHFNFFLILFEAKLTNCYFRPKRAKFGMDYSKLYSFMKNEKQRLLTKYVIKKCMTCNIIGDLGMGFAGRENFPQNPSFQYVLFLSF